MLPNAPTGVISYFVSMGDVFIVKGEAVHYFSEPRNLSLYNIGFQSRVIDWFTPLLQQLPGYHTLFVLEPAYRKQNKFLCRLQDFCAADIPSCLKAACTAPMPVPE